MKTTMMKVGVRAALLAASMGWASTAMAEPTLSELDQKVKILERKLEIADEAAVARAKESPSLTASAKDGFSLQSADKSFRLRLRGYVQADGRFFLDDGEEKSTDTFLLRRVRPILEGTLYGNTDFRIMPDFGEGKTVLQDAYAELKLAPPFNVRAGKFKSPVGLERLQSGTDMAFIERGYPTSLLPNRDVGVQVGGGFASNALTYAVGVFNGVVDGGSGDSDGNDGKDVAGRLFLQPFVASDLESLSGLGFGIAGTVGDPEGTQSAPGLPTYKSVGQQTFFSYRTGTNLAGTVIADGNQTRISPQAYYYLGPFGLLTEYALSSIDVRKGSTAGTLDNDAWQVVASYVVTGEKASFKGVTPRRDFKPSAGTWGAVEVLARYGELNVDEGAFGDFADPKKSAESASSAGVGLNWYLNKGLKVSLNYDQTSFEGGDAAGDRPEEKALFSRVQVAF
jgi:phosphate-selective porin OprO and OprP